MGKSRADDPERAQKRRRTDDGNEQQAKIVKQEPLPRELPRELQRIIIKKKILREDKELRVVAKRLIRPLARRAEIESQSSLGDRALMFFEDITDFATTSQPERLSYFQAKNELDRLYKKWKVHMPRLSQEYLYRYKENILGRTKGAPEELRKRAAANRGNALRLRPGRRPRV